MHIISLYFLYSMHLVVLSKFPFQYTVHQYISRRFHNFHVTHLCLTAAGVAISILLFLVLSSKNPPHWSMQCVLVPIAFVISIVWLNILANEVVSILRSFGLLLSIDTGTCAYLLYNCTKIVTSPSRCVTIRIYKSYKTLPPQLF